jgi:hypothetical protein
MARASLGDPGGLEDYREAIELATEAGQGREVALLHNNLGMDLWAFEGPAASLEVTRDGIAFATARGITEMVDTMTVGMLDQLLDVGEPDEALEVASDLAERLEASGDRADLVSVRGAEARILALCGRASRIAASFDWLESAALESGDVQDLVIGLGSSALARAALGQSEAAARLLAELAETTEVRETPYYPALLSPMVRAALGIRDPGLAERLASGVEPRYPYAEHALVAANAALAEDRGDLQTAADAYAEAADRWERFGVVPEQAFALLGQGRSMLGLSRPTEAALVLEHAREIFDRLQAASALAETDALLHQAIALSS